MISAYDFYNKKLYCQILNPEMGKDKVINPNPNSENLDRENRLRILQNFFLQFINKKYHKFTFYAHNFSTFDGILLLEALFKMCEENGFKFEPIIRENKIISLKIRFGLTSDNRFRYHVKFHDSLLILLTSLDKLAKLFLTDHPDLMKIQNKDLLDALLYEKKRKAYGDPKFISELQLYCERDSISLAYIINKFSLIIYDSYKLNVHKYPTISSLALNIYLTHFLKSNDLIPLISGEIYKDISKAYHGGHTDVYRLYSDKPVYYYDFISMFPSQMCHQYMPCGKITKFNGNPLLTGETLETLKDQLAFIKCTVFVDQSIKRPVYQTLVNINGELRSVCATGTFLNQWVYIPKLVKYEQLTNGLTKILIKNQKKTKLNKMKTLGFEPRLSP